MGRVFFEENVNDPFNTLDNVLQEYQDSNLSAIIVDFHAEATSEKKSLGHYADGRVSLFYGTHTHVATADEEILPQETAYITDIGMAGLKYSSLGMDFENIIKNFMLQTDLPKELPDHGLCIINGIFAKIDIKSKKAIEIQRVVDEVEV